MEKFCCSASTAAITDGELLLYMVDFWDGIFINLIKMSWGLLPLIFLYPTNNKIRNDLCPVGIHELNLSHLELLLGWKNLCCTSILISSSGKKKRF